jgi:hypothetical protein
MDKINFFFEVGPSPQAVLANVAGFRISSKNTLKTIFTIHFEQRFIACSYGVGS